MARTAADTSDFRARVDSALAAFLSRQYARLSLIDPALVPVADALTAFIVGGGKRLRPAFAYWGYLGAGGVDSDALVATISALELLQAGALIHDDVMDASDTRRGEPSIHRRFEAAHRAGGWQGPAESFGTAAALLLGDLCLVWSDEMVHASGLDAATLARGRPVFDEMRTEVMVGQYLDVLTQATGEHTLARAEKVARYKSAKYTVERPLQFGGALAGGSAALHRVYSRYGLPLGEAFQLRDDILGVFGDPSRTGKPAGDDLREGKRTFLVASALQEADPEAAARLNARLGDDELDDAGVTELREIITSSGALKHTEARIAELTAQALAAIEGAPLAGGAADALRALATAATHRAA